jgi:hypothetical protein
LLSEFDAQVTSSRGEYQVMIAFYSRLPMALLASALLAGSAQAQSGPAKPSPGTAASKAAAAGEAAKNRQKQEFAEAARLLKGPEANPECVWLGRRVVTLLWRDDIDTALRHLQLYDRFGCPDAHIQSTFRCILSQGPVDPKTPDGLNGLVQSCWLIPSPKPAAAAPRGKR